MNLKDKNYFQVNFYEKKLKQFEFIVLNRLLSIWSNFTPILTGSLVTAITHGSLLTPGGKFKNKSICPKN